MFCKECGKEVPNGSVFCPECGASLANGTAPAVSPSGGVTAAVQRQQAGGPAKPALIKPLRVLSVIGFIWFPLEVFAVFNPNTLTRQLLICMFWLFAYALAHAIVALKQGNKHHIKPLPVMAVIGITGYTLCFLFTIMHPIVEFLVDDPSVPVWFRMTQITAVMEAGYALAFSIVTFVKAKLKPVALV